MDRIKVLVTIDISESLLNQLRELSPRLHVDYFFTEIEEGVAEALSSDTEVLYTRALPSHVENAPRLQWIQFQSAGIDNYSNDPLMKSSIAITTTSGAHAGPGAEFVLGVMIALARNIPQLVKDQSDRLWERSHSPESELRGKTLGIIGYGSIGRELARIASPLGMRILAVKRNVHELRDTNHIPVFQGDPEGTLPERVFAPEQLNEVLRESDFVVVTAPLTRDTEGMIGEAELRVMKPTSFLINVARAAVVDLTALTKALEEGWFAGAALDVFEPEPLPATSDLWNVPNLLITPHVLASRSNLKYDERCNEIFIENLRRYLDGRPLLNLVQKEAGY